MPDCLLRDELLESERWLWLPSDTDRLCYTALLLRCDDFGNIEAGIRRLFRFFHGFSQVKTEEAAATVLGHLNDADLTRAYAVDNREFLHVPRFRSIRSYLVRKCPPSPWCDPEVTLGKRVRKVINQGLAKNLPVTLQERSSNVLLEVEVEVEEKRSSPVENSVPKRKAGVVTWAEHWKAKGKAFGIEAQKGESEGAYCRRVLEYSLKYKGPP